jgi:hypothetical protein
MEAGGLLHEMGFGSLPRLDRGASPPCRQPYICSDARVWEYKKEDVTPVILSVRVGDLIEQYRHIPKAHSAARNPHMAISIRGQTRLQAAM